MNPYKNLEDHCFWRRSVSTVEKHKLDPVITTKFRISEGDKIATGGSCFSQRISQALVNVGLSYLVTEDDPDLSQDERTRRNYGVFSARYGNIYTARHFLQLVQEVLGQREPKHIVWPRSDGQLVDALRPTIEPDGFSTEEALFESRRRHLDAVRELIQQADVFIFTLGLTEGWRSTKDGTVYPLAPGVSGGVFDPEEHEFVNFTVGEVTDDLNTAFDLIKSVNNDIKILLTVSPVPLIATYEPRHALVSNTYTKSVLRVAAAEVERGKDWIDYFPSYEMVIGNYTCSTYYADDLREVNRVGIAQVMRIFMKHYIMQADQPTVFVRSEGTDSYDEEADIVCDEEEIEEVNI